MDRIKTIQRMRADKYKNKNNSQQIEISNSQRYRLCGNGIVIDVVKHILKSLF